MIVVDASVATKWLVDEVGSTAALEILNTNQGQMIAPAIIRVEVANAVIRHLRDGSLSEIHVRARCATWERMLGEGLILLTPTEELFEQAVTLAIEIRHTVPDCLYLALAKECDAAVVTADRPMYERGLNVHREITFLGNAA